MRGFPAQLCGLLASAGFEACESETAILGKVQEVLGAHKNAQSVGLSFNFN